MALLVGVQPAAAFPQMQSQGSSFAAVAIQQWVGQAGSLYGLNINFQVSSSVLGLNAFAQGGPDFVASDIPYSSGQADSTPSQPYQYLPDVAGALAFMYNLNGIDGQQIKNLVLNASTVDAIFTGKISYWDDPGIKAINPPQVALNLPHSTIVPVYREDASGENYLLSDYLLRQDGGAFLAYQQAVGDGTAGKPSAQWPGHQGGQGPPPGYPNYSSAQGQNGSDGVANYVSALSSEGSIGYLETAYAIEHNFPVASIVNASGHAVQPTSVNDATALEKAILFADLTQDLTNVYTNPLPNAYPVSAYSYFVTPCSPSLAAFQKFNCAGPAGTSPFAADRGAELGQFIQYVACAGQEKMALLGYSPLPPNLVQEDFNAIGRLNGGHQPPPPTASTCRNPYVDGEVPLPGEPAINTSVGDANSAAAKSVTAQAAATASRTGVAANSGSSGSGGLGASGTGTGSPSASAATTGGSAAVGGSGQAGTGTTPSGADPYLRFAALQRNAAGAGSSVLGPALLWCLLLALAVGGPVLGRWAWRGRGARASRPDGPARAEVSPAGQGDRGDEMVLAGHAPFGQGESR